MVDVDYEVVQIDKGRADLPAQPDPPKSIEVGGAWLSAELGE